MYSYAQNFEDIILERIFAQTNVGVYVDVGAAHPLELSVTKHFYERGWSGINIDPIPSNIRLFEQERPRDINLCCAVTEARDSLHFYEVASNRDHADFDNVYDKAATLARAAQDKNASYVSRLERDCEEKEAVIKQLKAALDETSEAHQKTGKSLFRRIFPWVQ